jgi:hypothetical protein
VSDPVLRRLLVLPVVALVLVVSTGCAKDVSPAVQIDRQRVSDGELMDEVSEWAHNPSAYPAEQLATHNPGTYPMELVTAILGQRIDLALHHDEFVARHLELTDDLRSQAVSALFQGDMATAQQALGGFSTAYQKVYVDEITEQLAVEDALGADYQAWRTREYLEADIHVSPRYGTWDGANGQVVPPKGPAQPAGALTPGAVPNA